MLKLILKRIIKNKFKKTFINQRKSYLRSVLKGYRNLDKQNNLSKIWQFKRDLTNTKLIINNKNYDEFLFIEKYCNSKEIIFRQYLLDKFLNSYFNQDILNYFGKNYPKEFIGGYPKEWLDYLSSKKIKVSYVKSLLIWKIKIILNIIISFRDYVNILKNTFLKRFNNEKFKRKIIYFNSISNELIKSSSDGFTCINRIESIISKNKTDKYDIIVETNNSLKNLKKLKSKNIYSEKPLSSLKNYKKLFELTIWYIKALFICSIDLIFSRGIRAFLIIESLKTKVHNMNFVRKKLDYAIFNCSTWIYKPLWTYSAEKKGTKVIFYFYSINSYQLSINPNDKFENIVNYGWESNSWNNYFVWNEFQEKFINYLPNKSTIKITGPILHENELKGDLPSKLLNLPKKISLFDITIFRDFLYRTEGMKTSYEKPEIAIKFIKDVLYLCKKKDIHILYKGKRNFSKKVHPKYRNFIKNIDDNNFHIIDPNTSLNYLFSITNACISFPFTSTSLVAKYNNIPSCFYDPSGQLINEKNQTHNIELISTKDKLGNWLDKI